MDTTIQTALKIISTLPSGHWRRSFWIGVINKQISDYRLTALKNNGTELAQFCIKEAEFLESELNAVSF